MINRMLPSIRMGVVGFLVAFELFSQTSVLTQHNDISRTGQNLNETILNPATVSSGDFGKLFSLTVDGQVLAQPLYTPYLKIGGATHNVVFVATEHDSVYAFDADAGGAALWQASLLDSAHGAAPGATTDPESDTGCGDIHGPEFGITGTPVIDPVSKTLYVVSLTFENNYPLERLHALDIETGAEKFGGPVVIKAAVAGTGSGSSKGMMTFDPKWENQRAGLLLVNGTVYVAFGAHCDLAAFHGWLMAYNAVTLAQTATFLTSPNGLDSGIWMAGSGLSADVSGGTARMFIATGNGSYDAALPYGTDNMDYGDSILRLDLSNGIKVSDAFTPHNQASLSAGDNDVGSGGVLILPDQTGPYPHLLAQAGKTNSIYLVDRDSLGGYSTTQNNIVQEVDNQIHDEFGMPAYWNGNLYVWSSADRLKQFSLTNGVLSSGPVAMSQQVNTTGLGSTPSISANGTANGIVWAVDSSQQTQVLYAYDATNIANTLWSSAANSARDAAGTHVKFPVPTIANGEVFVGSVNQVMVYGLFPTPDFLLSDSSFSLSTSQGGKATDTMSVRALNGFAGSVAFSAFNLPAGMTVAFSPSTTATASIATFSVAANATPGTYPVAITGVGGALSHTLVVNVQVVGVPDFALSATPSTLAVQQGSSAISRITVSPIYGFTGVPTFSVSGMPTGVAASFSTANSTLTFSASGVAWVGSFPVTLTGTYNSITHSIPVSLSVTRGLALNNVQLVNKLSDKCLDVSNRSTAPGAAMGQWDCWGGASQLWNLTTLPGKKYTITSINSGLVLDISGSSASAGADVIQDAYSGLSSQQWTLQKTVDGYFTVIDGNSVDCLAVAGASLLDGASVIQSVCAVADSQKWSLVPLSKTTTVDMSASYNVNAIATDGASPKNTGIDLEGNAYPEAVLGSSYSYYGYPFVFGPANLPDSVSSLTVKLPYGQFNSIAFLGLGVNGNRPSQTFTVTYSDGTSATFQQSLSDWGLAQNYAGEYLVLTSSYRIKPDGTDDSRPFNLYGYGFGLDSTRTPVSLTLPANRDVVILAISLGQ